MLNILRSKSVVLVAILGLIAIFAMGCNGVNNNFENEPAPMTDPML